MVDTNKIKERSDEDDGTSETRDERIKEMSSFAGSYMMPFEKVLFYKDLRTFGQKYLGIIFSLIITIFSAGIFFVVALSVDDGDIFFAIGAICFVIGILVTFIIFLLRSVPELVLSDKRVIFFSGRKGNQLMEDCPYDKLSGFQARRVRRILPIVIGILLILGGVSFVVLGIINMEGETDTVETSPGVWEEVEVEPDTLDYMGPLIFGAFLLIMGILILIFMGFVFNYVFKMTGGNIIVPCSGRKNRENATMINNIIMNMRESG